MGAWLVCCLVQTYSIPLDVDFFKTSDEFEKYIFSTDIKNGSRGWLHSKKYIYPLPVYGALYCLRLQWLPLEDEDGGCDDDFLDKFLVEDSEYELAYAETLVTARILKWLFGVMEKADVGAEPDHKTGRERVNKYLNLVAQYMLSTDFTTDDSQLVRTYIFDANLETPSEDNLKELVSDLPIKKELLEKQDKLLKNTLFKALNISLEAPKGEEEIKAEEEEAPKGEEEEIKGGDEDEDGEENEIKKEVTEEGDEDGGEEDGDSPEKSEEVLGGEKKEVVEEEPSEGKSFDEKSSSTVLFGSAEGEEEEVSSAVKEQLTLLATSLEKLSA